MDWKREVENSLTEYFEGKLEDYKFRNEDEEDDVRAIIDECIENAIDLLSDLIGDSELKLYDNLNNAQFKDNSRDYDR